MGDLTGQHGSDPLFTQPAIREAFLRAIRAGASYTAAQKAIGIAESTWTYWQTQAKNGKPLYVEFMAEVHAAEAQLEVNLTDTWLDIINVARQTGDHRPLMEFMSRRFKKDWSPTYKAEVGVTVDHTTPDSEEVLRRLIPELTSTPEASPAEQSGELSGGDS